MESITKKDLEKTGLMQYVDFFAGIRPDKPDYKKGKPHFRAASEYFEVPFEAFIDETIFVGDTFTDIDIAKSAGIISVVRIGTYPREDLLKDGARFTISNLSELLNVLSKLN